MSSVTSADSATVAESATFAGPGSQESTPTATSTSSLAQKAYVRWVLLLLPTAVVLGPVASYPINSGGLFTAYRMLYIPAAVFLYIIWHDHGKPRFAGSRALFVFLVLLTTIGLVRVFSTNSQFNGTLDHFNLSVGLLMAWLVAAAVSCDSTTRNTLLTGWYVGYMVAALLALLHATGIFVPQTFNNVLIAAYESIGQQIGYAGTLGNPNDLAAFALAGAPIAYLAARRWERSSWAWMVLFASMVMGLVSLSRTAVLGLFLIPLVYVAYRRSTTPGRLPVLIITSVYALVVLMTINATGIAAKLEGVPYLGRIVGEFSAGVAVADSQRIDTWAEMVRQSLVVNPWGMGPGQYEALVEASGFELLVNAHNVFLEVLLEYGIVVGLAGLIWMAIVVVSSWQRARCATDSDNLVVALGASALMGLIVWGVLTSSLIPRPPWALLLGTAIGLISSVPLAKQATK